MPHFRGHVVRFFSLGRGGFFKGRVSGLPAPIKPLVRYDPRKPLVGTTSGAYSNHFSLRSLPKNKRPVQETRPGSSEHAAERSISRTSFKDRINGQYPHFIPGDAPSWFTLERTCHLNNTSTVMGKEPPAHATRDGPDGLFFTTNSNVKTGKPSFPESTMARQANFFFRLRSERVGSRRKRSDFALLTGGLARFYCKK